MPVNNPDLNIDTIELFETDLPAFDGDKVAAKMNVITEQHQNDKQRTEWEIK